MREKRPTLVIEHNTRGCIGEQVKTPGVSIRGHVHIARGRESKA
jgi:hypothetical protein